jgi:hypothetical protein
MEEAALPLRDAGASKVIGVVFARADGTRQ